MLLKKRFLSILFFSTIAAHSMAAKIENIEKFVGLYSGSNGPYLDEDGNAYHFEYTTLRVRRSGSVGGSFIFTITPISGTPYTLTGGIHGRIKRIFSHHYQFKAKVALRGEFYRADFKILKSSHAGKCIIWRPLPRSETEFLVLTKSNIK